MCDVKTTAATAMRKSIEATAMQNYLPCKIWEDNCCTRFENYKSNCNAGLSPFQKYWKTILVLNLKIIKRTAMQNYLPCKNMGRQLLYNI